MDDWPPGYIALLQAYPQHHDKITRLILGRSLRTWSAADYDQLLAVLLDIWQQPVIAAVMPKTMLDFSDQVVRNSMEPLLWQMLSLNMIRHETQNILQVRNLCLSLDFVQKAAADGIYFLPHHAMALFLGGVSRSDRVMTDYLFQENYVTKADIRENLSAIVMKSNGGCHLFDIMDSALDVECVNTILRRGLKFQGCSLDIPTLANGALAYILKYVRSRDIRLGPDLANEMLRLILQLQNHMLDLQSRRDMIELAIRNGADDIHPQDILYCVLHHHPWCQDIMAICPDFNKQDYHFTCEMLPDHSKLCHLIPSIQDKIESPRQQPSFTLVDIENLMHQSV